jgi:GTP-binding protein
MAAACRMIDAVPVAASNLEETKVFRPQPQRERVEVTRDGDVFVVSSAKALNLVGRMDVDYYEARAYIWQQLGRMGIIAALKRAGAEPGAIVRFGDIELEWD